MAHHSLHLDATHADELKRLSISRRVPSMVRRRARIILMLATGHSVTAIMRKQGVTAVTVRLWRKRFMASGIPSLIAAFPPRQRRPYRVTSDKVAEVIRITTQEPPEWGLHWPYRDVARRVGIGATSVLDVWKAHGLKPHQIGSFRIEMDMTFARTLQKVVGLYINPPDRAIAFIGPGPVAMQSLFSRLTYRDRNPVRDRALAGALKTRHAASAILQNLSVARRSIRTMRELDANWIDFMDRLNREHPTGSIHIVTDNYDWNIRRRSLWPYSWRSRFHIHFIPPHQTWLAYVDAIFGVMLQRRPYRVHGLRKLIKAIRRYGNFTHWWTEPFIWTAPPPRSRSRPGSGDDGSTIPVDDPPSQVPPSAAAPQCMPT